MMSRNKEVSLGCIGATLIALLNTWPTSEARAEIFVDTVTAAGTWIFERFDCGCPPCVIACPLRVFNQFDFEQLVVFEPPLGEVLYCPYGVVPLGIIPLDKVDAAPDSGYVNLISAQGNEEFTVGHTYVLRTRGGGHALIIPLGFDSRGWLSFEYKYQNDGTGNFRPVSIQQTTWGRLKFTLTKEPR